MAEGMLAGAACAKVATKEDGRLGGISSCRSVFSARTRRGTVHNPGPLRINELHAVSSVMAKRAVKLAYARGSRGVLS
jgi:hypothetical protein